MYVVGGSLKISSQFTFVEKNKDLYHVCRVDIVDLTFKSESLFYVCIITNCMAPIFYKKKYFHDNYITKVND